MTARRRRYPELPGAWHDLVVLWGSSPWDGHQLGAQRLAEALSLHAPVLYVDPPLSSIRALRAGSLPDALRRPRLRLARPGLAVLSPIAPPGKTWWPVQHTSRLWLGRGVRHAVQALGGHVRAVISGPELYDPFGLCGERSRIFRASDDFGAAADLLGVPARRSQRGEERLASRADLVVCVSEVLVEKWRARGRPTRLVPNGCDVEALRDARRRTPPPDIRLSGPVAGYVGQLSTRMDFDLVRAVADRGHGVLLVGPLRSDLDRAAIADLLARPNVQWVGPKPAAEVPAYVGVMAVGLVPYAVSEFNRASFPLKTLEYLAAGAPVVATDLPAVRWLDTDLVRVASDPRGFADAVDKALVDAGDEVEVARRQGFAAAHGWDRRAQAYLAALDDLEGAPAPLPDEPSVTVALVTYDSGDVLPGFLDALDDGMAGIERWRLVVADNASADASLAIVRERRPDALVVELGGNKGYAAGVNAAAAAWPSDAVLVINPDARLGPGSVRTLLDALRQPGTGVTVPRINDPDGRLDPSLRREPTVLRSWGEAVLGGGRAGRFPRFGDLVTDPGEYERPGTADWASGSAMLVSRACLDAVGPWDETFFLYSEETEFALRARDRGWALRYVPEATVVHLRGSSATAPDLRALGVVNKARLYRRRHGPLAALGFRLGLMATEAVRAARGPANRAALRALVRREAPR